MTGSSFLHRLGVALAVGALSLGIAVVADTPAQAQDTRKVIKFGCGTSRGATLVGAFYDDVPGEYQVDPEVGTRVNGTLPNNTALNIRMQTGSGTLTMIPRGYNPGYFDKTTRVVCDGAP